MTSCQRWRERRAFYRPAGELFSARFAGVEPIEEARAKAFVTRHHYSGSYPAARFRAGLFLRRELVGVAVFSVPMNQHTIPRYFDGMDPLLGVELGRLVLLDHVAANAESWFCARAFRMCAEALGVAGIVTYADPVPRVGVDGRLMKPGHLGIIYQALNASYRGLASPRVEWLANDGRILAPRALSKVRNDERGTAYVLEQMRSMGAPDRLPFESGRDYVTRALRSGAFRSRRHPGNHAYTFWLDRNRRAPVGARLAYPKPPG